MRQCLLCSRQYEDDVRYCPHDGNSLPAPDTLVGRVIDGKYRIEALHGSGGMGAVYRAIQVNLDRPVALKVVKGDFLKDTVITERFKREALAIARLKHPNIVTVYDYGIMTDGGAYLVMEFLEGHTLRTEIQKRKSIPIGPGIELMRQICSAVHAAHVEGIIHRDLKPDNIFLERGRDDTIHVKILDFGVAKMRANTGELQKTDLTMSGAMLGTPLYMSPEQCLGEPLDVRSDLYSLGCVFFEMISGQPPFTATTATQLIIKHAQDPPPALMKRAPSAPPGLEAAFMRALAKSPEDRFQTAAEFGQAIGSVWIPLDPQASFPPVGGMSIADTLPSAQSTEFDDLIDQLSAVDSTGGRRRVAVLPFRLLRPDDTAAFLSVAIADAIITELSTDPSIIVRPTSAVERFHDTSLDPRDLGRQLDVDMLVTGNFLKQGNSIQLNAQLVDIFANEIVWRHRLTAPCDDLFTFQDEVTAQVANGVRTTITRPTAAAPLPSMPTPPVKPTVTQSTPVSYTALLLSAVDPAAKSLYEEALDLGDSTEDTSRAIGLLDRAVGLDPDFPSAWAELAARHYAILAETGRGDMHLGKAREAAERALARDPSQIGTCPAVGRIYVDTGYPEEIARRALGVLNERPSATGAHFVLGYACRFGGLLDRALAEFRATGDTSQRLVAHEIATIYAQKQLYPDALRILNEINSNAPRVQSLFLSAVVWAHVGDPAGTRDAVNDISQRAPSSAYTLMGQVLLGRLEGRNVHALLGWLTDIEPANGEVQCWLAQIHAFANDQSTAVARLRSAVTSGYFNAPYLVNDTLLAPIRALREVQVLIDAAKMRHEQFAKDFQP